MAAPALKTQGVDGRVKHGHDEVGGWVSGHDGGYYLLQKKRCYLPVRGKGVSASNATTPAATAMPRKKPPITSPTK